MLGTINLLSNRGIIVHDQLSGQWLTTSARHALQGYKTQKFIFLEEMINGREH